MSAAMPGWYRDPCESGGHRYWDGDTWDALTGEQRYGGQD